MGDKRIVSFTEPHNFFVGEVYEGHELVVAVNSPLEIAVSRELFDEFNGAVSLYGISYHQSNPEDGKWKNLERKN